MPNRRKWTTWLGASAIILISLVAVALSPLAFEGILKIRGVKWGELSNVGQTYGAMSTLLAALALVGVAASIHLQGREARYARMEVDRTRHFELTKLALDNPLFLQVVDVNRYEAFVSVMWLQYWRMLWVVI